MLEVRKSTEKERSDYGELYTVKDGSQIVGLFTTSITGNCQIASVHYMRNLMALNHHEEVLKAIKKYTKKPMILVDISTDYCDKLEKYFPKDAVVLKAPYTSTNGSNMVIYLLKLGWLQ